MTAAVNVTLCPYADGLCDEETVVVAPTGLTVWVSACEVLPVKFGSPP
jgi:hypothetical protein